MPEPDARKFEVARGGTEDTRPLTEKPYSAASYTAQYGIPLQDAQAYVEKYHTHGEVKQRIYREFLSDSKAREAALRHQVRPYGEMTDQEKIEEWIQLGDKAPAEVLDYIRKRNGSVKDPKLPRMRDVGEALDSIPAADPVDLEVEGRRL